MKEEEMQELYLQIPGVKELVEANNKLGEVVGLYKEARKQLENYVKAEKGNE